MNVQNLFDNNYSEISNQKKIINYFLCKILKRISELSEKQRTKEWYIKRYSRFTASLAILILDQNYIFYEKSLSSEIKKVKEFYLAQNDQKKIEEIIERRSHEFEINEFTNHGISLEDRAVEVFQLLHPEYEFANSSFITNELYPFFGASPDGYLISKDKKNLDGALIEIKCPYSRKKINEVPNYYYDQMQAQMLITGISKCYYFVCKWIPYKNMFILEDDKKKLKFGHKLYISGEKEFAKYSKCVVNLNSSMKDLEKESTIMYEELEKEYCIRNKIDYKNIFIPISINFEIYYLDEYYEEIIYSDMSWKKTFLSNLKSIINDNILNNKN